MIILKKEIIMDKIKRTSTNILRLELIDIYDKLDEMVDNYNEIIERLTKMNGRLDSVVRAVLGEER